MKYKNRHIALSSSLLMIFATNCCSLFFWFKNLDPHTITKKKTFFCLFAQWMEEPKGIPSNWFCNVGTPREVLEGSWFWSSPNHTPRWIQFSVEMNNWTDDVVGYLSKGPPNKLKLENITEISLLATITAAAYKRFCIPNTQSVLCALYHWRRNVSN